MSERNRKFLLLGSCFAQNMGERLLREGYDAMINPLGTLYNPDSIRITLWQSLCGTRESLPMFKDMTMQEWRCWWANTQFRDESETVCRQLVYQTFISMGEFLAEATDCVITLGTNVCYRLVSSALTVTNCQRQPERRFRECRMTVEECVSCLEETLGMLWQVNPDMRVTLTVSPYRYRKYGLHGSQLSKAALLLAVDEVAHRHEGRVQYFPSYEIMMDELRDYSYYAEDGLHPSAEAVDIIWDRYKETL